MKVIGLTGTIASGKSVASNILKSKGFEIISLSSIIRDYLKDNNIDANRKSMQDAGNYLRSQFGAQILAQKSIEKFTGKTDKLVIDGIRNIKEVEFLRNNRDFILIGIDAPVDLRWERVKKRNRDNDLLNYDKFLLDDARDRGFNEPMDGQQVALCLEMADYLILNDDEFKEVEKSKIYEQINNILKKHNL